MWPSENVQNAGIHIKIARIIAMAHRFFYQSLDFRAFAHTRYRLNRQSNEMKKQQQQKCVLKVLEKRQKGHHNNNSNNNEIKRQIEREQAISWNVQWKPFCFSFFFDQPFGLHVLIIARWAVCLLLRRTSRAPAQAKNRNKKNKTQKLKQTVDAAAWAANVLLLPLPWPLCQFVAVLTLDTLINYLPNNPNDYYFISATV